MPLQYQEPEPQINTEDIEEIAEAIIDERWNELVKGINKIIEWKDETEVKLTKIEQEIDDLRTKKIRR